MTLGDWIVLVVGAEYALAALVFYLQGDKDAAGQYLFYAGANVFAIRIIMAARGL